MASIPRRAFLRSALVACAGLTLSACARPTPAPSTVSAATGPTPAASAPALPSSVPSSSPVAQPSPVAQVAPTQGGTLTPVHGAFVSLTAEQMLLPMTLEGGYFQKYGIDFQLDYVQGSSTASAGLVSNSLDMFDGSGEAVIAARAGGGDILLLASFVNQLLTTIVATPDVLTMDDVKGRIAAVSKVGSGTDYFYWLDVMQALGWSKDDVQFLSAGGSPGELALLQQNQAQAMLVGPPVNLQAESLGLHEVFDTGTITVPDVNSTVIVTRSYLASDRDTLLNVLRACIEGAHRWDTDGDFAQAVIGTYLKSQDAQFNLAGWQQYSGHIQHAPFVTHAAMEDTVPSVAAQTPAAANVDVDQTFDMSLVQEIVDSGFVQQVWGS